MSNLLFEALCATLDELSAGFIVAYPDGKILHANRIAQDMMDAGWPIRSLDGFVQGDGRKSTASLLNGLREVADMAERLPAQDCCLDICLSDIACPQGAAIATMKPLACAKLNGSNHVVALFVTGIGSRDRCALSSIAKCFGLTPAETKALRHFVEGGTVANVASALHISENTVKTHLQSIFAKTRSSRQPQLIKLVNDLTPPLRPLANVRATQKTSAGRAAPRVPSIAPEAPSLRTKRRNQELTH